MFKFLIFLSALGFSISYANNAEMVTSQIRQKMTTDNSVYSAFMFINQFDILDKVRITRVEPGLAVDTSAVAALFPDATITTQNISADAVLVLVDKPNFSSRISGVNRGLSAFICMGSMKKENTTGCALVPSSVVLKGIAYEGRINGPYYISTQGTEQLVSQFPKSHLLDKNYSLEDLF